MAKELPEATGHSSTPQITAGQNSTINIQPEIHYHLGTTETRSASADAGSDLREFLRERRPPTLRIGVRNIRTNDVPTKNPKLIETQFYSGRATPRDDGYDPTASDVNFSNEESIPVDQLFEEKDGVVPRSVAIVGEAGAGKSTQCARCCSATDRASLHSTFMQMTYGDRKVNLKEILLQYNFNVTEAEADEYMRQIVNHQDQHRILLDGYDQASWKYLQLPPKLDLSTKATVDVVIGNLMQGHVLPNVQLVITSRPHALMSLPVGMRPDRVFMLKGFSPEDARELFVYFVGKDGNRKWLELETSSPQLCLMCSNPAMLTYIASSRSSENDVMPAAQTITSVLKVVLRDIKHSDNTRHNNIESVMERVKLVAFTATKNGTVLIAQQDLRAVDLEIKDVEDLTVVFPGVLANTCGKLFDGECKLYFNHQTLQEYFAARYVTEQMSVCDFEKFVQNDVFTAHWTMVRRFLSGLLLDRGSSSDLGSIVKTLERSWWNKFKGCFRRDRSSDGADDHTKKQIIFLRKLLKEFEVVGKGLDDANTECRANRRKFLDLLLDVRECNSDDVTKEIAKRFPVDVVLQRAPFTSSEAHAFAYVIKHVTKHIDYFDLRYCDFTTHTFSLFVSGICESQCMITEVNMHNNSLDRGGVDVMIPVLPKIVKFFQMGDAFLDEQGKRRNVNEDERDRLRQALNQGQLDLKLCVGGLRNVIARSG